MGYFKIGKYKVFYADSKFIEINKPFYEGISATEMVSMKILGIDGQRNDNAIKLEKVQFDKLKNDFKILFPKQFIEKWVDFEFIDQEAKQLSWEIIYDYFQINKNGNIEDVRDFGEKVSEAYAGKDLQFPQGHIVKLTFKLLYSSSIFTKLLGSEKFLTKMIDLTNIQMIKGSLDAFQITTEREVLKFGKNIEIIASNKA